MARRGARGFTLVEMLVALTLLALLAAMLLGALRFGVRSWDGAAARTEERDETAAAQGVLRALLSEASTPGPGAAPLMLVGDSRSLTFVAPWMRGPGGDGLHRFTLSVAGDALIFAWAPEDGASAGGTRALLEGVAEMRVAYFGAAAPAAPPLWRDRWEEGRDPPRLVRIEVAFVDRVRTWPPLVVARGP